MYTSNKISDSLGMTDAGRPKQKVNLISPHYATVNPFNYNNTYLLLSHIGYSALYTAQGTYIKDLPLEILTTPGNPVWSLTQDKIIYFLSGNAVKKCDVSTNIIYPLKQFTQFKKITNYGEADISNGGDYLVLCGDDTEVFLFNVNNLKTSQSIKLSNIESLYITPFTNVLISYSSNGSNRQQGVELFNNNLEFIRQVLTYNPHKDLMLDESGEELLIHPNGNDPAPKLSQPFIIGTSLKDGNQRPLFKNTWEYPVHISCQNSLNNKNKFFFISRYDGPDPSIYKVNLDGTYEEVCKTKSVRIPGDDNYTYQPKAVCNGDGTRLVYSSNNGLTTPLNYCDTYLVNLNGPISTIQSKLISKFTYNSDKQYVVIDKDLISIYER